MDNEASLCKKCELYLKGNLLLTESIKTFQANIITCNTKLTSFWKSSSNPKLYTGNYIIKSLR